MLADLIVRMIAFLEPEEAFNYIHRELLINEGIPKQVAFVNLHPVNVDAFVGVHNGNILYSSREPMGDLRIIRLMGQEPSLVLSRTLEVNKHLTFVYRLILAEKEVGLLDHVNSPPYETFWNIDKRNQIKAFFRYHPDHKSELYPDIAGELNTMRARTYREDLLGKKITSELNELDFIANGNLFTDREAQALIVTNKDNTVRVAFQWNRQTGTGTDFMHQMASELGREIIVRVWESETYVALLTAYSSYDARKIDHAGADAVRRTVTAVLVRLLNEAFEKERGAEKVRQETYEQARQLEMAVITTPIEDTPPRRRTSSPDTSDRRRQAPSGEIRSRSKTTPPESPTTTTRDNPTFFQRLARAWDAF